MESIKFWYELKTNQLDEFDQFMWYKKSLKIGNKTVFCSRFFAMGIWTVNDLYYENALIQFPVLLARGAKQSDYMLWRGILKSIPEFWRHPRATRTQINTVFFQIESGKNKYLYIDKATEKQIKTGIKYSSLNKMKNTDYKAKCKFENIHGAIDKKEWEKIYTIYRNLYVDNYTKDLQYKILPQKNFFVK